MSLDSESRQALSISGLGQWRRSRGHTSRSDHSVLAVPSITAAVSLSGDRVYESRARTIIRFTSVIGVREIQDDGGHAENVIREPVIG
jgi:hypothetical protein